MKVYETCRASKKRINSKRWDWVPSEWSTVNPLLNSEGCSIVDGKRKLLQRVYFNVPEDLTIDDVKTVAEQMIVVTPFGATCLFFDFLEMLADIEQAKKLGTYETSGRCMFVHHPKGKLPIAA